MGFDFTYFVGVILVFRIRAIFSPHDGVWEPLENSGASLAKEAGFVIHKSFLQSSFGYCKLVLGSWLIINGCKYCCNLERA